MDKQWMRALCSLGLLAILAGCGGGGGGGGGDASSGVAVPVQDKSAQIDFAGQTLGANGGLGDTLSATATVTLTAKLAAGTYVKVDNSQDRFASTGTITASADGSSAVIAINTSNTLAAGRYQGTIALHLCSSALCSNDYAQSNVEAHYMITVGAPTQSAIVRPQISTLNLTYAVGAMQPLDLKVDLLLPLNQYKGIWVYDEDFALAAAPVVELAPDGKSITIDGIWDNAAPGVYRNVFRVLACPAASCSDPVALPVYIIVNRKVLPRDPANQVGLLSDMPDWATYAGNAAHSAYVPHAFSADRFSVRWTTEVGQRYSSVTSVVTHGGLVYTNGTYHFLALSQDDGHTVWSQPFIGAQPPALGQGTIYTSYSNESNPANTFFYGLDAATGAVRFRTEYASGGPQLLNAPVYDRGQVIEERYSGMQGYDASSGALQFQTPLTGLYSNWIPTVDSQYAYLWHPVTGEKTELLSLDRNTGAVAVVLPLDISPNSLFPDYELPPLIPLDDHTLLLNSASSNDTVDLGLYAMNPQTGAIRWHTSGYISGSAVGDGVVVSANIDYGNTPVRRVEVRDIATGNLLSQWLLPSSDTSRFQSYPVLTANLIIVSTWQRTYFIDRTTMQTVWTLPIAGKLAISAEGLLLILDSSTSSQHSADPSLLIAVNLNGPATNTH